ncbi:MAG: haloalkane dehalogenase [Gammaproteobacteria bacterium]|nr:haloalkane dehalogenase [Gammaproteobacteria bacterium]
MKTLVTGVLGILMSACASLQPQQNVSSDYPFKSQFVDVHGSKMHFVEQGEGHPILFLHGNPTSSYLWRNIFPTASTYGRAIAVDLIGMGKSDKPEIGYRFVDHYRYLEGFIEALELSNITLVIHDWGSALGFHYATMHSNNVRGIAFMEAILRPVSWDDFSFMEKFIFKRIRTPGKGENMVLEKNMFIEKVLPMATVRKLSKLEKTTYNAPFQTPAHRKPMLVWPREIPIEQSPNDTYEIVKNYHEAMKVSAIPKLLLYAEPGTLIKGANEAKAVQKLFANTEIEYIGHGKHFIQEDQPENISNALSKWLAKLDN